MVPTRLKIQGRNWKNKVVRRNYGTSFVPPSQGKSENFMGVLNPFW